MGAFFEMSKLTSFIHNIPTHSLVSPSVAIEKAVLHLPG